MPTCKIATPAFGAANLTNCEREQIHLAASIQPNGALLLVRQPDNIIVQVSANATEFLGFAGPLIGLPLRRLGGNFWQRARSYLSGQASAIPVSIRCNLSDAERPLNAMMHYAPDGGLVVEFERAGPFVDYAETIRSALPGIVTASSLQGLCDESAEIFRNLTGYDRVMVYRFDDAGHGEVFSETKKPELEAFLGNRYPASDIPQIARRLYERNRVRLLVDINYVPVPLTPRLSPITNADLDMSLCFLRSISPIHVQYLKNMGVAGTLVVSLMVRGRLWGLISCHHYSQRFLHFEMRAVCELLAEVIGTRITALESFLEGQGELAVRRLERRMVESVSREGDWRRALFDSARSVLLPLNATGAALIFEGEVLTTGEVPATADIRRIGKWLESQMSEAIFSSASFGALEPAFADLAGVASGVVATRVSGQPGEMLIWFRGERVRTVTWGGNPNKPASPNDDPLELSPRRSFAQWHQVVEGTCDPWTAADLTAARMIGGSVTDVILQFRSVRILIAQDQLKHVLGQVHSSGQPVVVADPHGKILETNAAFDSLLRQGGPAPTRLDDLPQFFADRQDILRRLTALVRSRQSWRGEVQLATDDAPKPFLMRADPVFSSPERVLGFVLMFTELTARKAAEAARRQFQEGVLQTHRKLSGRIDSQADLIFENLMSTIVENAQLAALEITESDDMTAMPAMLECLRISVARAAEVLEQIPIAPETPAETPGGLRAVKL